MKIIVAIGSVFAKLCVSPRGTHNNTPNMKNKIEALKSLIAKAYAGYDNIEAIVSYTMEDIMRGLRGQEQFASSYLDYEIQCWAKAQPFANRDR